jgi:hypothetical protein
MTAKEEDILTSQNLIKKGVVIDELLKQLIVTEGVTSEDLILGDKNAVMVAARILAYGPEYEVEITHPETGEKMSHIFNLGDCPFKELPDNVDYSKGTFEITLSISKSKVEFKLLTGKDEMLIEQDLKATKKLGGVSPEITSRLKRTIISVDGKTTQKEINEFVDNMLARDSLQLREEMSRVSPDIDLTQEVFWEGEAVTVEIPMAVQFFWPRAKA